jgi:hypothetical protein
MNINKIKIEEAKRGGRELRKRLNSRPAWHGRYWCDKYEVWTTDPCNHERCKWQRIRGI